MVNRHPPTDQTLAVGFAADADAYARAADALSEEHFGPRYYLFCHAFELILKAYFLASGGKQSDLRDIGHDLNEAFSRAAALGYQPDDQRVVEVIEWLSPYHQGHSFRYKDTGFKRLPAPDVLIQVFHSIYRHVEPVTRAAYNSAKQP